MIPRLVSAALAIALWMTAPAVQAFEIGSMTDDERQAFRAEVRAYLLENPEVIIEAVRALENRQAQEQVEVDGELVRDNSEALFRDDHSWVGGNPEGDVTLVEFADYRCGYCRQAYPEVRELLESDGNIRFILKEFPILGPQSERAARYAISVLQTQGDTAYETAHDTLMTFEGQVTEAALRNISGQLGLDHAEIDARMNSDAVTDVIESNRALAERLEISGTPSFVLDGQMLRGYVPLSAMREIVAEARDD